MDSLKFVFTGPPSSGKTSVLELLKGKNIYIVSDTSRELICTHKCIDISTERFSDMIFERQLQKENEVTDKPVVFLDMSLIECLVYRTLKKQSVEILQGIELKNRYTAIFLFHPLPFVSDGIRDDKDADNQKLIYESMRKIYTHLGYPVVEVPCLPLESRAKLINDKIKEFGVVL